MADADRIAVLIAEEGDGIFGTTPNIDLSAATYSMDSTDNSINDSGNGFVTDGLKKGMQIRVAGFTGDTSNNQDYICGTVTAGKIILREGTVVTDAAGETVTIDAPIMDEVLLVSESLTQETDISVSPTIRDDRQRRGVLRTGRRANGDVGFAFSAVQFDELLAAALFDDLWSAEVSNSDTTYAAVAAGNKITDSGDQMVADGFLADRWYRISGFTGDGLLVNNGIAKAVSVAIGEIVFEGITFVDDAAGESVTLTMLSDITNGTTKRAFTIEREYKDETTLFTILKGLMISSMSMSIPVRDRITGSLSFLGKSEASASATVAHATIAAQEKQEMSTVEHVAKFLENMVVTSITGLDFNIENNLREKPVIGTLGPTDLGLGGVDVTGSFTKYFATATILDKYLNFTTTQLSVVLEDDAGNAYVIDFPEVKITGHRHEAGGTNTDIVEAIEFSAFRDSTEDVTIRIARYRA